MHGLIVVPCDHDLFGVGRHVPDHVPLQQCQILRLVNDQQVEIEGVSHGRIERDHVHEVMTACLGLVLLVLLMDLYQLWVAERVVLQLVVLPLKRNLAVAGTHHALQVLGSAAADRGQHDAVMY